MDVLFLMSKLYVLLLLWEQPEALKVWAVAELKEVSRLLQDVTEHALRCSRLLQAFMYFLLKCIACIALHAEGLQNMDREILCKLITKGSVSCLS